MVDLPFSPLPCPGCLTQQITKEEESFSQTSFDPFWGRAEDTKNRAARNRTGHLQDRSLWFQGQLTDLLDEGSADFAQSLTDHCDDRETVESSHPVRCI